MAQEVIVKSTPGIGVTGLLGVAFVVLKLVGVIDWSWVWVLSPFWLPIVIVIGLVTLGAVVWGLFSLLSFVVNKAAYRKRKNIKKASKALTDYSRNFK